MNYSYIQEGNDIPDYIKGVIVDNVADIAELPTDWLPGSYVLCLENSSVYMLCMNGEWHEI